LPSNTFHRWAHIALRALLFIAVPAFAADGAALFQARCAACHGGEGAGNVGMLAPPIAGQDAAYLIRQLQQFRNKQRGGDPASGAAASMQAVALAIVDDASIDALAHYMAKMKAPSIKVAPPPPGSPLNAGKGTFSVCVACHGTRGEGNTALAAPRLNLLPAWYMQAQLKAFREGTRGTHADDKPGQQMRQIARDTVADDETVKAVSEYIATLGTGWR
jgi:cytochrome c553